MDGQKGRGKGKDRKGKQASRPKKPVEYIQTPDGRHKCFRFQKEKCNGCDRVHTCTICNAPHPKVRCAKFGESIRQT